MNHRVCNKVVNVVSDYFGGCFSNPLSGKKKSVPIRLSFRRRSGIKLMCSERYGGMQNKIY